MIDEACLNEITIIVFDNFFYYNNIVGIVT
jgi:hypothetical protein